MKRLAWLRVHTQIHGRTRTSSRLAGRCRHTHTRTHAHTRTHTYARARASREREREIDRHTARRTDTHRDGRAHVPGGVVGAGDEVAAQLVAELARDGAARVLGDDAVEPFGVALCTKKSGKMFRVGIFLEFVWLTTRTPHGAYVRRARRNRIDRHWGEIERLAARTSHAFRLPATSWSTTTFLLLIHLHVKPSAARSSTPSTLHVLRRLLMYVAWLRQSVRPAGV